MVEVKEMWCECEHCHHKWKARKEKPIICPNPKCHRVLREEEPKRVRP
jgi:hypothetical protein